MIPAAQAQVLAADLADRLAALDEDACEMFSGLWDDLSDERRRPPLEPCVRELFAALRAALEREHHRRMTGQPYDVAAVVEAIDRLTVAALREGLETHEHMRVHGAGLPAEILGVYEVVGAMLGCEVRARGRFWRTCERDVVNGRVGGAGWGWPPSVGGGV